MNGGFSPEIWGCILIGFALFLAIRGLWKGEFFRPLTLFLTVHSLAMGLAMLNLFWTNNEFKSTYFVVAFASWACFSIGCKIADFFSGPDLVSSENPKMVSSNWELIVPLAGMAGLFLLSRLAGGWPMLAAAPETAKTHLISGRFTAFLFSFGVFAQLYCVEKLILKKKLLYLLALVVLASMISLMGNRGQIFMALLFGLSLVETTLRKRIGFPAACLGLGFLGVFLVIGFIRLRGNNQFGESLTVFNGVKLIYVYFVNGQWNLSYGLETIVKGKQFFTWGVSSLNGFLFWFSDPSGLQASLGWDTAFNETVQLRRGLNSTSFQWVLIKDLGISGMLLATTVFGYATTRLHHASRRGTSYILLSAFLTFPILFSFNIFWLVEGSGSMVGILIGATIFLNQFRGISPSRGVA